MSMDTRIFCPQGPERLAPTGEGVLSGFNFVFKDLFDVEGYVTGAGNPTWLTTHLPANRTSPLIERLLFQGAECVGRVQTDELAYSLNGQNCHYGTPINPIAPDSIPGGSSSGSAVCVSGGICDFSIGTDTGGSIRVPASYNNIYGLRPTLGSLDLSAAFELAKSFDTAGILAISLPLLKRVYEVLSQKTLASTPCSTLYLDEAFVPFLGEERLARLEQWCDLSSTTLLRGSRLAELGYDFSQMSLLFRTLQGFEIISEHGQWLERHGDSLDPAIGERVTWARTITKDDYQNAQREQLRLRETLSQLMAQASQTQTLQTSAALWVLPTTPGAPPKLDMPAQALAEYRSELMGLTALAGLAGLPQLHLPMGGLSFGPAGISLIGQAHQEGAVIATGMKLVGEVDDVA